MDRGLPDRLETYPELRERGERFRRDVLASDELRDWSSSLWTTPRTHCGPRQPTRSLSCAAGWPARCGGRPAPRIGPGPPGEPPAYRSVGARALADQFHDELAGLVTGTIQRWDAAQTSSQLELLLGRDLQYIRINGTVVGAGVGLALHAIAMGLA